MLRTRKLGPTLAAALAAVTLATPAAQARPADVSVGSSPQSLPTQAFSPVHRRAGPRLAHWGTGTFDRDTSKRSVNILGSHVQGPIRSASVDTGSTSTDQIVPRSSRAFTFHGSSADATTALVAGLIMILIVGAVGVGTRTRTNLAT